MSATGAIRTQRRTAAKARGGAAGAVQPAPVVPAGAPAPAPSVRMAPAIGLGGQAQRPVQAQVAVGAPDDPFEREADRAATAVVEGGPTPQLSPVPPVPGGMAAMGPAIGLQRAAGGTCHACGGEAAQTRLAPAEPPVQMAGVDEPVQTAPAEPPVQQAETHPAGAVAGISPSRAARAEPAIRNPTPGSPMHGGTRAAIEPRLGADLSAVRVHDSPSNRRTGAALGARAFTHGNHIWLGPGEGQTDLGLMAHESAHVVQQGAAGGPRPGGEAGGAGQAGPGAAAARQGGTGQAAAAPPAPSTPVTVARTPATESGPTRPAAGAAGPSAGAGSAASAGADGSAGDAAGGGGGGPVAAAGGGGATGDGLLMPEPREGLSVADRARLAEVGEATGGAAEAYQTLPPAEEGVAEAQGAVTIPAEEGEARAEAALAAELGARPEPSAEIEALCARILEVIHSRQPPDEASLIESEPAEEAEAAGAVLEGAVEGDAERVSGDYAALGEEPPAAEAPAPEPIEGPPESVDAPEIGAGGAAPEPIAVEGALDADVEANAERIREAGMESEPAQEAARTGEGPIAEAMEAQGELAETAARDPAEVMAEQAAASESAASDMAALQARALESLQTGRSGTIGGVGGQQQAMVGSEEQMRAQVSAQAQRIFDSAREQVETLLEPLPDVAMRRWQTGVQVLSTRFDDDLAEVQRWLDERYSGVGGALTELADDIFGKPAWVTDAYNRAEETFAEGVCDLIREISTEVNGIIASCERLIEDADSQIAALFDALPESLRGWAEGERARMQESLDGLTARAHAARDDLTDNLAREAASTVQQARERVHALREAAKGLVGQIADAVAAFAEDPARFIIDGLLSLAGIPPASFWALVDRIGQVIEDIADDPIGFANNLVTALGQGFQRFFDNFGQHILGGFFDWLFSGLGAVGVTIPSDFSLGSIITFALELMGITWARIRGVLARHIGEENVALLERAYELIATLIEQGPEGIFELIKEQLNPQAILDQILQAAVDYLIEALIRAVTPRIIALFNPAGAIVQAVEVIYRVLAWIFEHAARIFSLVETVVNGAADLIAGNTSGMATAVEGALARLLSPVIDFLAGFLGLGSLPDRIADTIRGFQDMVLGVIDRVVAWLAERARGLLRGLGIGGADEDSEDGEGPYDGQLGRRVGFEGGGTTHHLFVEVQGGSAVLVVQSAKQHLDAFLDSGTVNEAFPDAARKQAIVGRAKAMAAATELEAEQVHELIEQATERSGSTEVTALAARKDEELEGEEVQLADLLAVIFNGLAANSSDEVAVRLRVRVERLAERAARVEDEVFADSRLRIHQHGIERIRGETQTLREFVDDPAALQELENDIVATEEALDALERELAALRPAAPVVEGEEEEPVDPAEQAARIAAISAMSRREIADIPDGLGRLAEHDDVRHTSPQKALSIRQELAVAVGRQRRAVAAGDPEQEVRRLGREVTRGGHPVGPGQRPATELDVVTGTEQIDVKGGDFSAREALNASQREQIRTQVRIARAAGRTPVLVFDDPVSAGVRDDVEALGATVEEGIDLSVLND